jgi:hypothetical protein
MNTKYCKKCDKILDISAFHKHKKHGLQGYCISCNKLRRKKATSEQNKKWDLKSSFNMSLEEYNKKLKEQNYVCLVCGKKETSEYKPGYLFSLSVDHNHNTGENRGLLCSLCN